MAIIKRDYGINSTYTTGDKLQSHNDGLGLPLITSAVSTVSEISLLPLRGQSVSKYLCIKLLGQTQKNGDYLGVPINGVLHVPHVVSCELNFEDSHNIAGVSF
jgi:hypothetical protein